MSYDLDELDRLDNAATAAPWEPSSATDPHWMREVRHRKGAFHRGIIWCGTYPDREAHANVKFVAAARNAIPAMIADLRTRAKQIEHMKGVVEAARRVSDMVTIMSDGIMENSTDPKAIEAATCMWDSLKPLDKAFANLDALLQDNPTTLQQRTAQES